MTVASLCQLGLEQVKDTGTPPGEVGAALVESNWPTMSADVTKYLASVGLGTLINQAMSAERSREVSEQIQREIQEDRARRQEEARQRQEEWAKRNDPKCRERAKAEQQAYRDEIERIHDETRCRNVGCLEGVFYTRHSCVKRKVFEAAGIIGLPVGSPEQRAAIVTRVAEQANFNDRLASESKASWDTIGEVIKDYGDRKYQQAVRNMKSIMLVAADGTMKSLMAFTLDDVRSWKRNSTAKALSWAKRARFFKEIERRLEQSGTDCVSGLPVADIQQLAMMAEVIWKTKKETRRAAKATA